MSDVFEITSFLEGRTLAWGVFEDRFGTLRRRFTVEMSGHWQDGVFLLDELFTYDTGESETRTWRITPGEAGSFAATCTDCIGEARGLCTSDTIRMSYRFVLRFERRSLVVDFDDRIYRMAPGKAVNRSTMRKWGVKLGELSLMFQRADPDEVAAVPRSAA